MLAMLALAFSHRARARYKFDRMVSTCVEFSYISFHCSYFFASRYQYFLFSSKIHLIHSCFILFPFLVMSSVLAGNADHASGSAALVKREMPTPRKPLSLRQRMLPYHRQRCVLCRTKNPICF